MDTNFSITEENYIKSIFHLQQTGGTVNTNDLAATLHTKPASVTDMLKKLKAKLLLNYKPYQEFSLTEKGNKIALAIIRRHRLWECFLVDKLKFGWDEVHAVAEELEHVGSRKLIDSLDVFLGQPKFDPHGDPIPDHRGKMSVPHQISLEALPVHKSAEITAVGNQSSELLEILNHKKITIGTKLQIKKKFSFDNSLEIEIKNSTASRSDQHIISEQLAKTLFVKLL